MVYFDHNATSPLIPAARQAWLDASDRFIGNPSSPHRIGARADAALNDARTRLATLLGCDGLDIVWTSGATESNHAAIYHAAQTASPQAEVWVSAIEHPCLLAAARHYFPNRHRLIPVNRQGVVELDWIASELRHRHPALIAVIAANNETGVLQPWQETAAICREHAVPFFCDAVQWLGKLPATGLGGCDFVSGCAHKFGGPRGVGFLKCPANGEFKPLLPGGTQEDGRRPGTENVPGILAMLAALETRESMIAKGEHHSRTAWKEEFERKIVDALPGSEVIGAGAKRLWNTVSALMPETDCQQRWVVKLDKSGLAVSTGSACASGREAPSHVLTAMGYGSGETGRVLRFSSGWETTQTEWSQLLAALEKVSRELSGQPQASQV